MIENGNAEVRAKIDQLDESEKELEEIEPSQIDSN